jgi:hypothetical protein
MQMNNKHLVVGAIASTILAVTVYIAWPEESAPMQTTPDSAAKAAGLMDRMATNTPVPEPLLPKWQDPKVSVINGIKVPPVPDQKINNATIAGVDSDNNGIRDDLDRYIAENFANDPELMLGAQKITRAKEFALTHPSKKNVQAANDELTCSTPGDIRTDTGAARSSAALQKLSKLERETVNTGLRGQAFSSAFAGSVIHVECPLRK